MDSFDRGVASRPVDSPPPISRKELLRLGAALFGGAAACAVVRPSVAQAAGTHGGGHRTGIGDPRPVPGGFNETFTKFVPENPAIHAYAPAVGLDLSTITDFKGVVLAGEVQGRAHGSDGSSYWFDCDMRVMNGMYIGLDGRRREHAFG